MKNIFQKTLLTITIAIFLFFAFFCNCYNVQDEGFSYQVVSFKKLQNTEIIENAGILIRPEDKVLSEESSTFVAGRLVIKRSKPILVEIDGKTETYYTVSGTAKELFDEKGIELNNSDFVNVKLDERLQENSKIVIKRLIEKELVIKESISYKTIYQNDEMVAAGLIYKKQDGKNGILEKHYKEIYFGGIKTNTQFLFNKVAKAPTNEIFIVGKAKKPTKYLKTFTVTATAYSPTVAETDSNPWVTASGLRSSFGIIAVDPKVIPMGTLVYVDGYGYAVAGDTGGLIKGDKIDVFFYSTRDAAKWGVKKVKIYILEGKWKFPEKLNY